MLFKDLRVLKIKDIFRNQIALLVFDCLQGTSYQEYKQVLILNSNVHHYATRNNSFVIDKCKILEKKICLFHGRTLNYGQKSIRVVGPNIWNDMSLVIRNNTSQTSFKFHLKKHLYDVYAHFCVSLFFLCILITYLLLLYKFIPFLYSQIV